MLIKKSIFWTILMAACTGIEYLNALMYGSAKSEVLLVAMIGFEVAVLMPLANKAYQKTVGETLW